MENIANKSETLIFVVFCTILFTLNLITAGTVELSFDEAYYWMFSEHLSLGYFDHPPFVAIMIKAGTQLFGHSEIAVRFFANILSLVAYFIMWKTLDFKKTWFLVISIASMPLLSFSGIVSLPDTPLLFFTALFFYQIKKYLEDESVINSIVLSIIISCMFYSKYHGLLIVLLTVCANLNFLKQKTFWLTVLLTTIFFLPHMYWQYLNDFVSFEFHLFGRKEKHFEVANILNYLGGQIALMGFFNFLLLAVVFYKMKIDTTFERILAFNSFGFLVFLFFLSFRNQIEANWTVSVSVALILLFAPRLEEKILKKYYAVSVFPIVLIAILRGGLLNLDLLVDKESSSDNRINEIFGWRESRIPQIEELCGNQRIVADAYQVAAKVSFYLKQQIPAIHINSRESQYSLWKFQSAIGPDEEICYLTSNKRKKGAVKVETLYKDPVYVVRNTTLTKQAKEHGLTYEKITGR